MQLELAPRLPLRLLAFAGVAAAMAWLPSVCLSQESPASFSSVADQLPTPGGLSSAPPSQLAPVEEMVAEVRILGNDTTSTTQIITNITTRAGRPFDETVVQRDVRNLANLGWFVDVKSLYERTSQGRIVIFQVVERPTIRYVQYVGNTKVKDKTLAKQTLLKVGGSVDPYAVQEGKRKLRDYYVSKGFNNIQISILEGDKPTDQGVTYLVHEGVAQRIWKTDFVGNDSDFVSDGRLKTLIKSKPPILYLFKGYVDRDKIDADIATITDYYRAHGYFQARVSRQIRDDEDGEWSTLTFVIHEGIQSKVRNVSVIGNTKFEQKAMEEKLALKSGEAFEQAKMQKDTTWLQELYGSQGYVFADVQPETIYLEEPGQVDLRYDIKEGDRFRVGRIFVHINGDNPHTRIQTALNRVTLRPGQIMDIRELKASERRLVASSLFHMDAQSGQRPKITYRIPEDADVSLAERPTGNVRGQSPDTLGPPVLPPLGAVQLPAPPVVYDNPVTPPQQGDMEVHYYLDDLAHFKRWQAAESQPEAVVPASQAPTSAPVEQTYEIIELPPAPAVQPAPLPNNLQQPVFRGQSPDASAPLPYWAPQRSSAPHVVYREPAENVAPAAQSPYAAAPQMAPPPANGANPNDPYGNVRAVRGQSPQPVNQAYSTLPAGGAPAAVYNGEVRATTPGAVNDASVMPTQYSSNIQPPAGSVAPQPLSPLGPLPMYNDTTSPLYVGPPQYPEQAVDIYVDGSETQTGRLMIGFGVNSDAGVVGNVVVDERNFDWTRLPTSWEDIRNGSAFRGAGQRFRIDASPGSEVNRYLVSFQEPYLFDRPISLGLSGSYFDRNYRDWDEQRIGGRISLGHQWVERDLSATLAYRGENVEIYNPAVPTPDILAEAVGDNVLHGFRLSLINDTRDSAFLATQGHYVEVGGEAVIGSFDYPRVDLDFRQYWMLHERPDHSGRHVLSFSTTVGYTGNNTPIYENFFAGGFATLRGFDFRGASPVEDGVEVGGQFQWLNSVQYLFPITADDMLHGVAFCDFGTVEQSVTIKDFRVAPGIGARITVPAMGPAPIALDFAFPVSYAEFDDRQVFSFSMGFSR